jgi:4-amino-4-deoxy-L-arabinose transferase-like glycosyltransferase
MIGWIVRLLMIPAGAVTSWIAARDAVKFSDVQMMVALLLLILIVAVLALWPFRWTVRLNRLQGSR